MPTDSAARALSILRDPQQFQWYVIPLFALVVYVYANEIERRNWDLVFAGLAFWGMAGAAVLFRLFFVHGVEFQVGFILGQLVG